jgi:dipeptidyl aminopeptidase/acylaminoacyl peptidase
MHADRLELTLRGALRETLDREHGPHPTWSTSPAARRVAEAERRGGWPLRALAVAAVVGSAIGAALLAGATNKPAPTVDIGIFGPVADRPVFGTTSGIWGANPDGSVVRLVARAGTPLAWSRDGTRLLLARDGQLFILHADGSETQVTPEEQFVSHAALSPDGARVVFTGGLGQSPDGEPGGCCERYGVLTIDADGGSVEMLVDVGDAVAEAVSFSPDGSRIAYAFGGGDHGHRVWIVDADGTDAHEILANEMLQGAGHVHGLAWSPAGDRIALGLSGTIYTFATDGTGLTPEIFLGTHADIRLERLEPYWSPDGSQLETRGPWHPGRVAASAGAAAP